MRLSDQLKQDYVCGYFGEALEGYSERAAEMERLLMMCVKDLFSPSGKFKKQTALELTKYVHKEGISV